MFRFAGQYIVSLILAVTVFAVAAFGAGPPERVKVTATIFPLVDIVRQVGGNRVHVVTLVGPGVLPSSCQLTGAQIRQTSGSGLYVNIGGGFDSCGDRLFSNAVKKPITITITDLVGPHHQIIRIGAADKSNQGQAGVKIDPWIWLDPIIVRDQILPAVTNALIKLNPGSARYFKVNERKYFEQLTRLNQEMWSVLQRLPGQGFFSTSDIWGYMAKRYGLQQLSVDETSIAVQAAQSRGRLEEIAKNQKISAIFGDPWSKVAPARQLAERIHGRFMLLDPLGGEQLPGRYSYIALMNYNLSIIRNGL